MTVKRGHCLCGAVSWQYAGRKTWACHCHCDDCRRNCSAPFTTFIGVPLDRFRWTGKPPRIYASSPGVKRHFCETCGTPMAFEATHYAGEIHLYAASLEDPAVFEPQFHVHYAEHLPWVVLADNLKRYPGFKS
jgi:hypothetical protein